MDTSYNNFQLTQEEINAVKRANQQQRVADYIRENGVEPDYATFQSYFTATADELELRRRARYSMLYEPSQPAPQHDYVEIGGIKWATMNVGATSVTDYGLYFQWGDTQGYTASQVGSGEGQKSFEWTGYKYANNSSTIITKYNATDGLTTLELSDDAVNAAWGGSWRMPTSAECNTLINAVNFT